MRGLIALLRCCPAACTRQSRTFGHLGENGIDKEFQHQVRDYLKPGASALFMVIEQMTEDKAVAALEKYGHRDQDLAVRRGHQEAPRGPRALERRQSLPAGGSLVGAPVPNRAVGDHRSVPQSCR